jgi:hypothetical protein
MKGTWSVVVIYENEEARDAAVQFCDRLVERFWSQCEFDVSWWSSSLLEGGIPSAQATDKAVNAQLVVFAVGKEIPRHARSWIENWILRRGEREGACVALLPGAAEATAESTQIYLREVAHRAGMDFLTQVPQSISSPIADDVESCTARAHQTTSVLEEILRTSRSPSQQL